MKILILPKAQFEESFVPKILNGLYTKSFFISILDPDNGTPFLPDSENFKTFWFWDLDEPVGEYTEVFDVEMANNLLDFVEANLDKDNCIVHCSAGVSRSGAVGEFVQDILGEMSYSDFRRSNKWIKPNVRVKTLLNSEYNKRRRLSLKK